MYLEVMVTQTMVDSSRKINVATIVGLFILCIPMMPVVSMPVYYALGGFVVLLFLLHLFKYKTSLKLTHFEILYILFILWNIISLKWSTTGEKSIIKWCLLHFVFVFSSIRLLYINLKSANKTVEAFGKWYVLGTFLVSLICLIYEHPFSSDAARLGTYLFREPYGTRMMYTYSLEVAIFFSMYDFFETKGFNSKKLAKLFLVLFFAACILLSGTRKILIGVLLFTLSYIILKNKKNAFKMMKKLIPIFILLIISYFCIMKIDVFYNILGKRIETALSFINGTGIDASMRDRNAMIDYGIELFEKHPIIGNGSNIFHHEFNIYYGQDLYSHNNFVEILCNLGLVGFILYYLNYVFIIFNRGNSKYKILLICTCLSFLVLDYWTISYYRIQFMIVIELTSLYFLVKKKNKGVEEDD